MLSSLPPSASVRTWHNPRSPEWVRREGVVGVEGDTGRKVSFIDISQEGSPAASNQILDLLEEENFKILNP